MIHTLILLAAAAAFGGDLDQAPPNFEYRDGKAVFVDFISSEHRLLYRIDEQFANYDSVIKFKVETAGYPIFDFVPENGTFLLDGHRLSVESVVAPDGVTKYQVMGERLEPGIYELSAGYLADGVTWGNKFVREAFFLGDLSDRNFLERYLPSSFEFDRQKMTYTVIIAGEHVEHEIFANGKVEEIEPPKHLQVYGDVSAFKVSYPDHFNSSAPYFHITEAGRFTVMTVEHQSIDGKRVIPVTFYGTDTARLWLQKAISVLTELEADYGPYPHNELLIYGAGSGGMEYHGATRTSLWALEHEITHFYFARGLMPANGDSGWLDEAIASWRDQGYQSKTTNQITSDMGRSSAYNRRTDRRAYDQGRDFISFLANKVGGVNEMKKFLKTLVGKHLFAPYKTEDFVDWMNDYFEADFIDDFNQSIFGESVVQLPFPKDGKVHLETFEMHGHNPMHPVHSKEDLNSWK